MKNILLVIAIFCLTYPFVLGLLGYMGLLKDYKPKIEDIRLLLMIIVSVGLVAGVGYYLIKNHEDKSTKT